MEEPAVARKSSPYGEGGGVRERRGGAGGGEQARGVNFGKNIFYIDFTYFC